MAYNQLYPQAYQPTFYQPQPQIHNNRIWVQGKAGAKSYQVAPNTTVDLWDSEEQKIYLKSADASGIPSMRTLNYTIEDDATVSAPDTPKTDFATKDDILSIQEQINELRGKYEKERTYERKSNTNGKQLTK